MNPIATATIIRGKGECHAYMNGVVMEEMKKLNERHALEMTTKDAELEATRGHRNRLLADNLEAYREVEKGPRAAFRRLRERLGTLWAQFWALGVVLGFWEHIEDDERQREEPM